MPASFKLHILNPGLEEWPAPIARGLDSAGTAYQSEMKRYPPKESTTSLPSESGNYRTIDVFNAYTRTGTLGHMARYQVSGGLAGDNMGMDVGGVKYTKYVLFGTGLYGPEHRMITPKTKKFLAWRGPRGWIFAKATRGAIWAGKLEKVQSEIVRGFTAGFKRALGKQ